MCQLSVSPAAFLRLKAKTALPCLIASLRSASLAWRALLMASKAADEGNLSAQDVSFFWIPRFHTPAKEKKNAQQMISDITGSLPFFRDIVT